MLLHIVVLNPNLRMNLSDELPGTDMITLTCLHGNTYRQASCCPSPSGCRSPSARAAPDSGAGTVVLVF